MTFLRSGVSYVCGVENGQGLFGQTQTAQDFDKSGGASPQLFGSGGGLAGFGNGLAAGFTSGNQNAQAQMTGPNALSAKEGGGTLVTGGKGKKKAKTLTATEPQAKTTAAPDHADDPAGPCQRLLNGSDQTGPGSAALPSRSKVVWH